ESMRRYGLEFFHMTDFMARVPPYDWSETVRWSRLQRLVATVNAHASLAVGSVVPLHLYRALSASDKAICDSPYRVAAMGCVMKVSRWIEQHHSGSRVVYVFEAGAGGAGKLAKFFDAAGRDDALNVLLSVADFRAQAAGGQGA